MELTKVQLKALELIDLHGKHSGRFFRAVSISPRTLNSLKALDLVGSEHRVVKHETEAFSSLWFITDAGRAALGGEPS